MATKARQKYTVGRDIDLSRNVVKDKNGRRITTARAEKIAADSLKRVVGRPSLSGKAKVSPEIKARVPVKLKAKLDREARRRGETASSLIREALEKFLKSV